MEFQLQNTGGLTFESMVLTVEDIPTSTVFSLNADDFIDQNGCSERIAHPDLPPGTARGISSSFLDYNPDDREMRAVITLCSSPGQSGTCTTQMLEFVP